MIQINVGDHAGSENGVPFAEIPLKFRGDTRWARTKAIWIAGNVPKANAYFLSLPARRSLSNLLADSSIWIKFDPTLADFGETFHNNDLWIGPRAFKVGRWTGIGSHHS